MSQDKNISKTMTQVARNKKAANSFAKKTFNVAAKDIIEEHGNLHALFQMSVPLYTPGSPKFLFVPLDLYFYQDSQYTRFTVMLTQPFYVNIERSRLEKITSISAAFLSQPEWLQLVQPRRKSTTDTIPEIGVIYMYGDELNSQMPGNNNGFKPRIFKEIQQDLLIFFSMLCNHLGVSVDYLTEHAGIGCSELVLD